MALNGYNRFIKRNYNVDNEDKQKLIRSNLKTNLKKINFIDEALNIVNDYFISEVNNVNTNCFLDSMIDPFNYNEINIKLNSKQLINNKEYFNSCIDSIDKYLNGNIFNTNENVFKNLYGEQSLDKLNEIYTYNATMNDKKINLKNENNINSNENEKNQLNKKTSITNQSRNKQNQNISYSSRNENSINNSIIQNSVNNTSVNNTQNSVNNTSVNNTQNSLNNTSLNKNKNSLNKNKSFSNKNQNSPKNKSFSNKNQNSPNKNFSNKNQISPNKTFSNKNKNSRGDSFLNNTSQNQSISKNSFKNQSKKNSSLIKSEIENEKKQQFSTVSTNKNKILPFKENVIKMEDSYIEQKKNDLFEYSTRTNSNISNKGNKNNKHSINQKKQSSEIKKKNISRSNTKINNKKFSNTTINNDSKLNLALTFTGSKTVYNKRIKNIFPINLDNTANYSKLEKENQRKKLNRLLLDENFSSKRKNNKSYDIIPPEFEILDDISIVSAPKNTSKLNKENEETLNIIKTLEKENEKENENENENEKENEKDNNNENNRKNSGRFSFKYI